MLGSLSTLTALESEAADRSKEEAKVRSRLQKIQSQQEKIQKLRQKRDELLQKLHNSSTANLGPEGEAVEAGADDPELQSALTYAAELREKLSVYKLTGVSVVKTSPNSKVLCLTTSYRGVYFESYHVKLQRLDSGHFKVIHHDLPPFIPCAVLPSNLEVKDMQSLVRPLREALAMFVRRREELKGAEAKFPDSFHVMERSGALDFLCCHLDVGKDVQLEITLKYSDLNDYLPKSLDAVPLYRDSSRQSEPLPQDVLESLQTMFCDNRLCVAVTLAVEMLAAHFSSTSASQSQSQDEEMADSTTT